MNEAIDQPLTPLTESGETLSENAPTVTDVSSSSPATTPTLEEVLVEDARSTGAEDEWGIDREITFTDYRFDDDELPRVIIAHVKDAPRIILEIGNKNVWEFADVEQIRTIVQMLTMAADEVEVADAE